MTENKTDEIYFAVTVDRQRAEYLGRCLTEPLCSHCGREVAECCADPCADPRDDDNQVSVDPAEYRGGDYGDDEDTQRDNAAYVDRVKATGNQCPSCGHKIVEGDFIAVDGATANQEVDCNLCSASWYDQYALVGFSNLEIEDDTM